MLKPRTHFEQVSLEIVRKIVEEQIRRETTMERDQGAKKKTSEEDLLEAQQQSMVRARKFSQVES